jgi:isocitrate/isopropylmalate dehydrogenase
MTQTIAVIRGDGIGPEIMDATLSVLDRLNLGLPTTSSTRACPPTKNAASCCRRRPWTRSRSTASR